MCLWFLCPRTSFRRGRASFHSRCDRRRDPARQRGDALPDLPRHAREPSLGVAGGADQVILKPDLGQTAVARLPQPMGPHQFAVRPLDGIALPHPSGERLGLLLPPALLEGRVVLAHADRAVGLPAADALVLQRAVGALAAPLEAKARLAGGLLLQPA